LRCFYYPNDGRKVLNRDVFRNDKREHFKAEFSLKQRLEILLLLAEAPAQGVGYLQIQREE
jgi:hypothetical protein